ncbi:MAG: hypothetical protein ACM32I_05630 [Nitrospirota bacterium]
MRYIALVIFLLLLSQTIAFADHLPEELLASGKPETILAGIDLKITKLKDVIRKYGSPIHKESWVSGAGYVWLLPNAKIELSVDHGRLGEQIHDVYIEGTAKGAVGFTGRGLKLGDDINKLKSIYGNKFEIQNLANENSKKELILPVLTSHISALSFNGA